MNKKPAPFPKDYTFFERAAHKMATNLRDAYRKAHPDRMLPPERLTDHEKASDLIFDILSSDSPKMIARFGSSELDVLSNYMGVRGGPGKFLDYITCKQDQWWWVKAKVDNIVNCSGFFPKEEWAFKRYCNLMLEDMGQLDLLGSWVKSECFFKERLANVPKVHLALLEPWFGSRPWTRILEGKKVLVVHPFAAQIEDQYFNHREELFPGTQILPQFKLQTVQAVQSLGGTNGDFTSWFEALEWMESEIDKCDYDICIIGCGAYGFNLAAHVKRSGKKAVHLGGVTQMLFGIKGNRWEDPSYAFPEVNVPAGWYLNLINDSWVKADPSYRTKNADSVEGACYW